MESCIILQQFFVGTFLSRGIFRVDLEAKLTEKVVFDVHVPVTSDSEVMLPWKLSLMWCVTSMSSAVTLAALTQHFYFGNISPLFNGCIPLSATALVCGTRYGYYNHMKGFFSIKIQQHDFNTSADSPEYRVSAS